MGMTLGTMSVFCTTDFVTAPGRLDIARVFDDMVPTADNQSKQHTLSNLPSHHWATLSLRHADMGGVGGVRC